MTTSVSTRPVGKYKRGQHPNSRIGMKNLKPYPKGVNGHQGGYSLKERLIHSLDKPLTKPRDDAPVGEQIVYSTLEGALLREPTPFKEVWDRVEGRLQDNLPVNIDNRQVNIYVMDGETKELLGRVAERTKGLIEGTE